MKSKIYLLLILSIPFLLLNCSAKNYPQIPQVYLPPIVQTQSSTDVISLPLPTQPNVPTHIPNKAVSQLSEMFTLPRKIKESSGLIKVDNRLWTLNDSRGASSLYQIDERDGHILKTLRIDNASNKDWEDLAFDDNYVYIGDFGNNRGNRRNLRIYKIPRASLITQKHVKAEVIKFVYGDQKNFKATSQQTNYDCEAMVAYHGKLYLFSKNWGDRKTRLYTLPITAGEYRAKYIGTFDIGAMVTGASINKELNILLLTTYTSLLDVNVWAFSHFKGNNLLAGDAKKLRFKEPIFGQIEGVTFIDNYKAYLSSEAFRKYILSLDAMLYALDFSSEFE
jgi:hypothetical protein